MKNYTITVNGTSYDVTVEEGGAGSTPKASAPKAAPKQKAAPAQKPAASTGAQVNAGQAVKRGDVMLILEAMKMENEIVAPQDGTVASINVTVGQSVEAGDVLATLN